MADRLQRGPCSDCSCAPPAARRVGGLGDRASRRAILPVFSLVDILLFALPCSLTCKIAPTLAFSRLCCSTPVFAGEGDGDDFAIDSYHFGRLPVAAVARS